MKRNHRIGSPRSKIRGLSLVILTIGSFFVVISQIPYTTMPPGTYTRLSPLDPSAPLGIEWSQTIFAGRECSFYETVTDKNGCLYAVGNSNSEMILVKLDSNGNLIYLTAKVILDFNKGTNLWVADTGDIFCIFMTSMELYGNYQIRLAKFNSTGAFQWEKSYGGTSGFTADICITGDSKNRVIYLLDDARYSKFDFDGVSLQEKYLGDDFYGADIWCDPDGNVFMGGAVRVGKEFFVYGFDPADNVFLNFTFYPQYRRIYANKIWGDDQGNLYFVVEHEYGEDWQWLFKITRNGVLLWKKWIPGFFNYYTGKLDIFDLWCSEEGRLFLLGEFPTGKEDDSVYPNLIEISPNGDLLRITLISSTSKLTLSGDNKGNLFVNSIYRAPKIVKLSRDSDWDGESDLAEFKAGTNPLSAMDNSAIRQGFLNWGIVLIVAGVLAPIGELGITRIRQVLKQRKQQKTSETKNP